MTKVIMAAQVFAVEGGGFRIRYSNKKGQLIMSGTMTAEIAKQFVDVLKKESNPK